MTNNTTPIRFTKRDAATITGGLTNTSKMPCKSWSIPVFLCKRGAHLAEVPGSVCSKCYADRGFYSMYRNNIEPAQVARLMAYLDDPMGWVDAMTVLIGDDPYFRWFDAGDLQSARMLEDICAVARATPNTYHWLPTREYEMVAELVAEHGPSIIPPNLTIRISALMINGLAVIPKALRGHPQIRASEVHTREHGPNPGARACPAPTQGNKCGDCRACWHSPSTISYTEH